MSETPEITKECVDCGAEFQSHSYSVLGQTICLDKGLCPDCRKKQAEDIEKREKTKQELALASRKRQWRTSCGIPYRFLAEEFGTFDTKRLGNVKQVYNTCLKYVEGFPLAKPEGYRSLVIYSNGVWGLGKSHLVFSIAHHILNKWQGTPDYCPVLCVTEPNLFVNIRESFNRNFADHEVDTESKIIRRLSYVDLLIVDDMGKEEVADPRFVQRTWFKIINNRYNSRLPMVITANLDQAGLRNHLGAGRDNEASFDRLFEMTGGKLYEIKGESYRRHNVAK
jgi:DNA replication protein DnaC